MIQDECIENLKGLGLTLVQARVYYSLSKLGCATIKLVSKASNLARQDVYRVMPSLEKLGLVERVIDKPTKYKATPIKSGFSVLLQQRIVHDAELQKKTIELIKNLHEDYNKLSDTDEEQQFIITSEISLLVKKLMKSTQEAKISIETMGNWSSFESMAICAFSDLKKALTRGVQIRSITEKPTDEKPDSRYIRNLKKSPLYELRYISAPVPTALVIVDKKEMHISISNQTVSSLWSNNSVIVELARNYFEDNWQRALPTNKPKTTAKIVNSIVHT